jgi:hypothetical protein
LTDREGFYEEIIILILTIQRLCHLHNQGARSILMKGKELQMAGKISW